MKKAIIIPARYGSSRFPGKPLALVRGLSTLERVWRIAKCAKESAKVVISTEDERVARHAVGFGAVAVLTSDKCKNGTERVLETVKILDLQENVIINLQGDALLTPPWVLDELVDEMARDSGAEIVTPAVQLDSRSLCELIDHKVKCPASGTSVVFDLAHNALYFSKAIIPFTRVNGLAAIYRHIGLYGFRRDSLEKYIALEPTPLELTEGLEQLRALEHGMKIRVVIVDYKGRTHGSIDAPEDVPVIEDIIAREGELFEHKS
jgi:3-deoxy-manno-octulosonate cytidylyltransferase (CMP-KDO synthetase)